MLGYSTDRRRKSSLPFYDSLGTNKEIGMSRTVKEN